MDIYLAEAVPLGHFQQAEQMLLAAVHAARRYEAQQMQGRIVFPDVFHGFDKSGLFKKRAFADILGDLRQGLIDDAAGADIQMADFGVADLAVRQAYVFTRRA